MDIPGCSSAPSLIFIFISPCFYSSLFVFICLLLFGPLQPHYGGLACCLWDAAPCGPCHLGGFGASFTILITSYSPEVANVLAKHVRKMGPVTITGLCHPGHWWILCAPFLIVVLCGFFVCLDMFCGGSCHFGAGFERVVLAP